MDLLAPVIVDRNELEEFWIFGEFERGLLKRY